MEIDISRLRRDLIDYFGTGSYAGIPALMSMVWEVEKASPRKLIQIALEYGFNLEDYSY